MVAGTCRVCEKVAWWVVPGWGGALCRKPSSRVDKTGQGRSSVQEAGTGTGERWAAELAGWMDAGPGAGCWVLGAAWLPYVVA